MKLHNTIPLMTLFQPLNLLGKSKTAQIPVSSCGILPLPTHIRSVWTENDSKIYTAMLLSLKCGSQISKSRLSNYFRKWYSVLLAKASHATRLQASLK